MERNALYFEQRALQERSAAESASHPAAREAHLDLARRYDEAAQAAGVAAAAEVASNVVPITVRPMRRAG